MPLTCREVDQSFLKGIKLTRRDHQFYPMGPCVREIVNPFDGNRLNSRARDPHPRVAQ